MGLTSAELGAARLASGTGSTAGGIFALALIAGLVTLLVWARRRDRRAAARDEMIRAGAVRRAAAGLGLQYSGRAPADVSIVLLSGEVLSNFLHGRWKGIDMVEADSTDYLKGQPHHNSVVAADIPANFPRISIEYAPGDAPLASHLHPGRLHLESEEFERTFSIGGKDRLFATAFLDPEMMAWLEAKATSVRWEVEGSRVAGWHHGRVDPRGFRRLLDLMADFVEHIPKVVLADYPPTSSPPDAASSAR